jgi:uncharacterized protein YggE
MKPHLIFALPLLAMSCTFSLSTAAEAQMNQTQTISGTRLELQARGESRVVPDIATISAGVVTHARQCRAHDPRVRRVEESRACR